MYSPKSIANWFIDKAVSDGKDITPIKLLKLIYIAHGTYLAVNQEPLISEKICAWKYGPVIESIYHEFKKFGNSPITEFATVAGEPMKPPRDEKSLNVLENVWHYYKDYTGNQLANWSHEIDGPWYKTFHEENGFRFKSHPISNKLIKDYFTKKLQLDSYND